MKTMAMHWEEQFEDVMRHGRRGQFKERLEWFLFKLHREIYSVETQSDGSKLLVFSDGSVYPGESDLDALLSPSRRPKHSQAQFARGEQDQKRCRKGNGYVGQV